VILKSQMAKKLNELKKNIITDSAQLFFDESLTIRFDFHSIEAHEAYC